MPIVFQHRQKYVLRNFRTSLKSVPERLGGAGGQHLPDCPGGLRASDELRHLADGLGQLAAVVLERRGLLLRHREQVDHRFSRMRAWNSRTEKDDEIASCVF